MTINKTRSGNSLIVAIEGRLDTTTAPQLEAELKSSLDGTRTAQRPEDHEQAGRDEGGRGQ